MVFRRPRTHPFFRYPARLQPGRYFASAILLPGLGCSVYRAIPVDLTLQNHTTLPPGTVSLTRKVHVIKGVHFLFEEGTKTLADVNQKGLVFRYINFNEKSARLYQNDGLLIKSSIFNNLIITGVKENIIYNYAKKFNLEKDLFKPCELLSGGQKRLVQFLRVVLSQKILQLTSMVLSLMRMGW